MATSSSAPWSDPAMSVVVPSHVAITTALQAEQGILDQAQVEECITSRFNPIRAGFHGHKDVWTRDVLNLGVRPDMLIEKVGLLVDVSQGHVPAALGAGAGAGL